MTRKKVTLEWIVNDTSRKSSLRNRRIGLLQKVNELSILCDVSASIIIYSPGDRQPMMHPSPSKVQEILARFNNMPEMERNKKKTNQETYLTERVKKVREQIEKHQRKHREIKFNNLMQYVYQGNGLDELNETDLQYLLFSVEEKRKEIDKRVEYCQHSPLSPGSLPVAPLPPPPALSSNQAEAFVPGQMDPNFGDNIGGYNQHNKGKAPTESSEWGQWSTDNIFGSSSSSKIDHMAGLGEFNQQSVQSSISGNQLELVGHGNYKPYFGCFTGVETTMGLQPFQGFGGLINTGRTNMPMLPPPPPLPPHIGVCSSISNFSLGPQARHADFRDLQKTRENDTTMGILSSPFERNNSEKDNSLGMQPYGNVKTGGNVNGAGMGLPFELFEGNSSANEVGFPYNATKQWPANFNP
ncbi:hypothetical protein Dsin_028284 [Dipteronia sinensis]|uniref:MADS-box domain-containing protein n=1 Tax=Dipteronia sinensis TaxID=43782 RepID=A0AAE0DU41_9ROSI|nr:hypothetical protein Dsin_028284 [Dipteronia sinensis]